MGSLNRRFALIALGIALFGLAPPLLAQTNTPTFSNTPTITNTPNATLTPPCGTIGSFGIYSGNTSGSTTAMRASAVTLSVPATVYTMTIYSYGINPGVQAAVAIFHGSPGAIGSLIVQSPAQTVVNTSYNIFQIPATPLTPGTYWLAYMYNQTYTIVSAAGVTGVNSSLTTAEAVTFGTFPVNMASPGYVPVDDLIYASYCAGPTATPTPTKTLTFTLTPTITFTPTLTPTITPTPTNSFTFTATSTPTVTNTGTQFSPTSTGTNTYTNTNTFTITPTPTSTNSFTSTPTVDLSLTPGCGASAGIFGNFPFSGIASSTTPPNYGLRGTRFNLSVPATVVTMSLYSYDRLDLPGQPTDTGDLAQVAIYQDNSDTMGPLLTYSSAQTLYPGWNTFKVTDTALAPGNYWLTYMYSAPATFFETFDQNNSSGFNSHCSPGTPWGGFPLNGSVFVPATYGTNFHDAIYANFCPAPTYTITPSNTPTGSATYTPTDSLTPTVTSTPTPTDTQTGTLTDTNTPTISSTPTNSPTMTNTGTPTNTLTLTFTGTSTFTPTITLTPTNSPTNSSTSTSTKSPTVTPSNTPSNSPTNTPTNSSTNTLTKTPTLTLTSTPSNSPTNTSTSSPTKTPTNSPTSTPTNSATPSPTMTATSTPTYTMTGTQSPTATGTSTFTLTATFSATSTSTSTSTSTFTSSPTATSTPTSTSTRTFTSSPTATSTFTPTSTSTFTSSPTATPTFTPTPNADIAKTASESVANINDIITYTITLTVMGGPVTNPAVSDLLPVHLNLIGFGSVPPGGTTSWNPSTRILDWNFPSLSPGTYSITYQAQVDSGALQGMVLTNGAQLTYNGLASPKTAFINVTMAMTAPDLFPNPVKDKGPVNLQVVFAKTQDYVTIKVFTTAFRKIYDDTVKSVPVGTFLYGLDPDHFKGSAAANGLYYVVISTPSNKWVSKLLIFR